MTTSSPHDYVRESECCDAVAAVVSAHPGPFYRFLTHYVHFLQSHNDAQRDIDRCTKIMAPLVQGLDPLLMLLADHPTHPPRSQVGDSKAHFLAGMTLTGCVLSAALEMPGNDHLKGWHEQMAAPGGPASSASAAINRNLSFVGRLVGPYTQLSKKLYDSERRLIERRAGVVPMPSVEEAVAQSLAIFRSQTERAKGEGS